MDSDNVIELNSDTLYYIPSLDKQSVVGVGDSQCRVEFINVGDQVTVHNDCVHDRTDKHRFKQLCIAWLALNYPDVLKYDDPDN